MSSSYQTRDIGVVQRDHQKEAKEIEKHRKAQTAASTRSAKEWKSVATQMGDLKSFVEQTELKQFQDQQKSLMSFLEDTAVPWVKMQWQSQVDSGRNAYATREQDPDTQSKFDKMVEEVEKLELSQAETYKQIKIREKQLFFDEDKKQLASLSHFEKLGFRRARLEDNVANFGTYREDMFLNSTALVPNTDGSFFELKDWSQHVGGREAASRYIFNQFYAENSLGLSEKYLTVKAIPGMEKIENQQETAYKETVRLDETKTTLEANKLALTSSLKTNDPDKIATALGVYLTGTENAFAYLGSQGKLQETAHKEQRNAIKGIVRSFAAAQPWSKPDGFIEGMKRHIVEGHPGGPKSFYEHFKDLGFSETDIKAEFLDAKIDHNTRITRGYQADLKLIKENITDTLRTLERENPGKPVPPEMKDYYIEQLRENPLATAEDFTEVNGMFDKGFTTDDQDMQIILNDEEYKLLGQISKGRLEFLDRKYIFSKTLLQDLENGNHIADKSFITSTTAVAEGVNILKEAIYGQLKIERANRGTGKSLTINELAGLDRIIYEGITGAHEDLDLPPMMKLALQYKREDEDNPHVTVNADDTYYIKKAASKLAENFMKLNKGVNEYDTSGHDLYVQPGKYEGGFINLKGGDDHLGHIERTEKAWTKLAGDRIQTGGFASLKTIPINNFTENDFTIDMETRQTPSTLFHVLAASDGDGGWDAWDFHNHYSKQLGLPIIQKPKEASKLRQFIPHYRFRRIYLNLGSKIVQDQTLEKLPNPYKLSTASYIWSRIRSNQSINLGEHFKKKYPENR